MAYRIEEWEITKTIREITKEELAKHVIEARIIQSGPGLEVDLYYTSTDPHKPNCLQRAGTIQITDQTLIKKLTKFGTSSDELRDWARENLPERMATPTIKTN